jgi:hypothetical protein
MYFSLLFSKSHITYSYYFYFYPTHLTCPVPEVRNSLTGV